MSEKKKRAAMISKGLRGLADELHEEIAAEEPDEETIMFLLAEMQSQVGRTKSFMESHFAGKPGERSG